MKIYKDTSVIRKWRYVVSDISILFKNEVISLPVERVTSFNITRDYENFFYPIINTTIAMDENLYYKIMSNKNDVQIHLTIHKCYCTEDNPKKYSIEKYFLDMNFDLIIDDEGVDVGYGTKEKQSSTDYTKLIEDTTNDNRKIRRIQEFYLYNFTLIKSMKTINDVVLINSQIIDAICYILGNGGVDNLIMSPPFNTTIYNQILIPPVSCIKALQFLDTYYGIYKKGSMIFFDLDQSYILEYNGKSTAYVDKNSSETNFIIPKENASHSLETGTLYDKDNPDQCNIIAKYNSVDIKSKTITNDITKSNNITIVDTWDGGITSYTSDGKTKSINNSTKLKQNNTENIWLGTTYTHQANLNSTVVTLNLSGYDSSMIKPNKIYNILFEDNQYSKIYSGIYVLTSIVETFSLSSSKMDATAVCTLKKLT